MVYLVVGSVWDSLRYSRLSPDDKTLELLLLRQPVLRLARENNWGDDRITGELKKLGYRISHETVRKMVFIV